MTNKLLFVVGSAYSGSSILSVLMDQVQGVVSVGEGARAYRPGTMNGPCATCRAEDVLESCELFKDWVPSETVEATDCEHVKAAVKLGRTVDDLNNIRIGESLYEFVGRKYPDAHTIVDSTKDPTMMVEHRQTGPDYDTKVVFLSKTPLEAFNSYNRHPKKFTPHDCVVEWLRVNMYYYGFLEINGLDVLHVAYRDLARRPHEIVQQICEFCGFHCAHRDDYLKPYGHILGGNPAVSSVVSGDDDLCFKNFTRASHMGGKYANVKPEDTLQIVYDESHKSLDFQFRSECQHELDKCSHKYGPLLQLLGYGPQEMRLF